MPLFFTAMMAMTLAVEKPGLSHGKLGDPPGSTEAKIWLLTAAFPFGLVLIGAAAMRIGRAGVVVSAVAATAAAVALLIPLDTWEHDHIARYPVGVDLIPQSSTSDIFLRGEWEGTARHTAEQLGVVTIVLSGLAIGVLALTEVRKRRRPVAPVAAPPPEVVTGGPS
jgi:hypothetical protein